MKNQICQISQDYQTIVTAPQYRYDKNKGSTGRLHSTDSNGRPVAEFIAAYMQHVLNGDRKNFVCRGANLYGAITGKMLLMPPTTDMTFFDCLTVMSMMQYKDYDIYTVQSMDSPMEQPTEIHAEYGYCEYGFEFSDDANPSVTTTATGAEISYYKRLGDMSAPRKNVYCRLTEIPPGVWSGICYNDLVERIFISQQDLLELLREESVKK